jgi:hypothetical protein
MSRLRTSPQFARIEQSLGHRIETRDLASNVRGFRTLETSKALSIQVHDTCGVTSAYILHTEAPAVMHDLETTIAVGSVQDGFASQQHRVIY